MFRILGCLTLATIYLAAPVYAETKNSVADNCTGGYFDVNNRWRCSTLITRFKPDGIGFGLKGTETGTIEVTTPITELSSNSTGLPLWPGTAEAETKNSSTVLP